MAIHRGWCEILAMLGLPSSSHMAYMFVVIDTRTSFGVHCVDIRPRKGLPPRSRCLFISDVAHKMMATFNFAPTSYTSKPI